MANCPKVSLAKHFAQQQNSCLPRLAFPPQFCGSCERAFFNRVSKLTTERHNVNFKYPFPPENVVAFLREYFGPTKMVFSRLEAAGQAQLTSALESLWKEHNQSSDGGTSIEGEYLEVKVVSA